MEEVGEAPDDEEVVDAEAIDEDPESEVGEAGGAIDDDAAGPGD